MVTRRRMLQGVGALALLAPFGEGLAGDQARGAAQVAQQEHARPTGDEYVPVTDPLVKAKLAQWSDWKFGIILHWGIYSVLGIVESWTLCSEDWIKRPDNTPYQAWKRQYEQLRTRFNPVKFDPARWADAAHAAGMRYVVFTTKHHDGFCMFDTAQTDYRVTAPDVPFHANPRANIAKAVFEAFRQRGFGIGAYFSKADWHQPDYWSPLWATPTRNNNYDVAKYPEMWQRFVDFTHAQIGELTTQYGRIDLMWLDAGWVNANAHPDAKAYSSEVPWAQDIEMPKLAAMARRNQPGIVMVDRDVSGPYQNYLTPEQTVPSQPLPYPWETCMTMGGSWSWNPHDTYKSPRELVHTLVGIVAKGGNLLLGIGPQPDGELPATALDRLKVIGAWMQVNGTAIHGSRAIAPYAEGRFRFTQGRYGSVNAIWLADEGEQEPPVSITLRAFKPVPDAKLHVLGVDGELAWKQGDDGVQVSLPPAVRRQLAGALAWTLHISAVRA